MKSDVLKQFVMLRSSLQKERSEIQARLQEIEAALGDEMKAGARQGRVPAPVKLRRRMSAAGRARIIAAAKARWARWKAAKAAKPGAKKRAARKKVFSAAARARLSASAKARWAKAKASGKKTL
jgi:hypothetical protein